MRIFPIRTVDKLLRFWALKVGVQLLSLTLHSSRAVVA